MNSSLLYILFLSFWFISACRDKPDEKVLETVEGKATYYGSFFHGKETKSGEIYDMNDMTAAHSHFPMGTKVKITNLENKKSVIVIINDTPAAKRKNRIDLSKGAFQKICHLDSGLIKVKMEVLAWGDKN